jgi:hypothetical protein
MDGRWGESTRVTVRLLTGCASDGAERELDAAEETEI